MYFYSTKFNKRAKNCSTTRAKNLSHDWLKVVKQKTVMYTFRLNWYQRCSLCWKLAFSVLVLKR